MKLLRLKRGQGGGMEMMLPLLMILIFVGLMMCQKKDEKKEQLVTPPVQPPQPTTPERNASSACAEAGFFVCGTCPTEESLVTDLPAGEGSVCCNIPCEACPEQAPPPPTFCPNGTIVQPLPDKHGCVGPQQCIEGNKSLTCAFQKGFACKETENCPDKQFIAASDSQRCCKMQCKARVQTELVLGDLGKTVIERFGAGKFGVYYGPNVAIGGVDVGKSSYADAVAKGNNVYEFKVQQKVYSFKVTKETDTEITAEVVSTPPPAPFSELEARTYLVDKYNPGTSFGMPRVITQSEIDGLLRANQELAAYVKTKYNLQRDIDVYNKMQQFMGIQLTSAANGYTFAFSDGQGCTITKYEGTVTGPPIADTVTKREQRQVPC